MSKSNLVKGIKATSKKVEDEIYRSKLIDKIQNKLHKVTSNDRLYLIRLLKGETNE